MTSSWERPQYPQRTSSRWPAPGVYVNVEFGVAMGPEDRTHTASMKYASRRMEERLHEERIRQQYEQGLYQPEGGYETHPTILLPANGLHQERVQERRQNRHYQQQERQRRLGVRTREQHERGTSAPPILTDRNQPISPISPVSPIGSLHPSSGMSYSAMPSVEPYLSPLRTSSMPIERSPASASASYARRSTGQASYERRDQPLPPTPSQFRLGDADLPWSMPPWYRPPEPEFLSPMGPSSFEDEPRVTRVTRRTDDPQRVRELESLQQAMMTVDSLGNDGWEPWTLDSVGDFPSGPRSIGWAVSSNDASSRPTITSPGPPPYVVSQWETAFGPPRDRRNRPRTAT